MIHLSPKYLVVRRAMAASLLGAVMILATASSAYARPPYTPITPVFAPWVLSGVSECLPATITGTVQDTLGNPVANAPVNIDGDTVSKVDVARSFRLTAMTDAEGKFVIRDVIEGTYSLTVNGPDEPAAVPAFGEQYVWSDYATPTDTRETIIGGTTKDAGTVTLKRNGTVSGRAMAGATPIVGSEVAAVIMDPVTNVQYNRWVTTGDDGRFTIPNAPAGNWQLTYKGSGQYVPVDALPNNSFGSDYAPVTISQPEEFIVTEGATVSRTPHAFQVGQLVTARTVEQYGIDSFVVTGISLIAEPTVDPDWTNTYEVNSFDLLSNHFYLPPGQYNMRYVDPLGCYEQLDLGPQVLSFGGPGLNVTRTLTPAAGTHLVHGQVTGSESGNPGVESWVTMTYVDPDGYRSPDRRLPTNGDGTYVMRMPASTGLAPNTVKLEVVDKMGSAFPADPDVTIPAPPVHVAAAPIAFGAASDHLWNLQVKVGGSISGTVTDDHGDPVPGVSVGAYRKVPDPYNPPPAQTWMNSLTPDNNSYWGALTDASGHYTIGGLPADPDYKVVFYPDYNPGWPLPIEYRDYNRRVYQNAQVADEFNDMANPPVDVHAQVSVTLGAPRTGIDTQIIPGGYVALHADTPDGPTGAVYCDVLYQVGTSWAEVDSGFTTGGTFHKDSKVLPAGHYRLDYSDYFGRGAGSWEFDLAGLEHKYASVIVPMPMEYLSPGMSSVLGSFDGLIDGGLVNGGLSDTKLSVTKLTSMPTTTPPPPANYIASGGIYNFDLSGDAQGVFTLTLPYDPAVPNADVGKLRVIHYKLSGTPEILVPFTWNTAKHTLQVQTTSLSPFRVMFVRTKVSIGRPTTSTSKPRAGRSFTVYGSLSPRHTALSVKSVRIKIYKYSRGKYRFQKYVSAKNYNYGSATRYKASLKLKAGKYRLYGDAPSDTWHLATTSTYRSITVR